MDEIKKINIEDKEYPDLLKKISSAPKILYYKGKLPEFSEKCIAIVGTRHPSPYGQQVALKISGELADAGLTIVSGMAPGIDTFAHSSCIEKRRRTIAVLGTGLDEESIYPHSNLDLSRKIVGFGGCLISELPPGTKGAKFTFPRRNRIISALSEGVIVIEAKEKSGSLITADNAKEQNKKLFAVPGQIYSSNSKGPNKLIKKGAILIEGAEDVIASLEIKNLAPLKQRILFAENDQEQMILNALSEEPLYIDKIIEITNLNASVVATTLALMEISGKIRSLGANVYALA